MDQKNLIEVLEYIEFFCDRVARHLYFIESQWYILNINMVHWLIILLDLYHNNM